MTPEIRQGSLMTEDGVRLTTYSAGPADAPVLLLANGIAGSVEAWRHLIARFADRFRIVSWDYRGLYHSFPAPSRDYSIERQCDDLDAVLAAEGIRQAVVVGWFMGVSVALEAHRRHPDLFQAMVLINGTPGRLFTTGFTNPWIREAAPTLLEAVRRAGPALSIVGPPALSTGLFFAFARTAGFLSPQADEAVAREVMQDFVRLDFDVLAATFTAIDAHDADDVLPTVRVPTLVVTGDRYLVTPEGVARHMAVRIPGAELLVVKGGTHYVPLEYPAVINLRLEKFLRERLPDLLTRPVEKAGKVRRKKAGTSTRPAASVRPPPQ